jgi:hypothetical protein
MPAPNGFVASFARNYHGAACTPGVMNHVSVASTDSYEPPAARLPLSFKSSAVAGKMHSPPLQTESSLGQYLQMTVSPIAVAERFLRERCDSLVKDTRHCVLHDRATPDWPAPFPALLYCFSTIDLLGALYKGDASRRAPTAKQAYDYMIDVMKYPALQADLLQQQFRHKLVHLAQPKPHVAHDGNSYHWGYVHDAHALHLQILPRPGSATDFHFWISIMNLAEDIADSVDRAGGYLDMLRAGALLQTNFTKAYQEIVT